MTGERDVIEAARAALEREAGDLGARESVRLATARREALAAGSHAARVRPWAWGGLATAAAGALGLMLWLGTPHGPVAAPPVEDLDLLASAEGLDFYADLDFYLWLDEDGGAG